MTNYGLYRCEHCHAEFITLDDKIKHIKKFHKEQSCKTFNMFKPFRQSVIWEYEDFNKV